jgi:2-polyprenyl-6-methoxyphenol hydroxylase-like FAD-dependent oxidoreductase
VKAAGLGAFRARVAKLAGRDSADEIESLDDVKLLSVSVTRLAQWHRPGLLFIGDAAHAMSPIGGVGINLAIQDAVAAANVLAGPLRRRDVRSADLQRVQARRTFPTRATQRLQLAIQNRVVDPLLKGDAAPRVPWLVRLAQHCPLLQRIPARVIGLGFRPEHVRVDGLA